MASRPDLTEFSVSPTTRGLPAVTDTPVRDQTPTQLQGAGDALQRLGGDAARLYTEQLRFANQLRVDEAVNQLKERQLDYTYGENGFQRQRGRDALFRPDGGTLEDEYSGTLDRDAADIANGLGNSAQRRAFQLARQRVGMEFREGIARHVDGEFQTYALSVAEGAITNQQQTIALNPGDPAATDAAAQSIRAQVVQQARLLGRSAEWAEAQTRTMLSTGHTAAIAGLLEQNDVSAAERYLDLYRDGMTAQDILRVDAQIGQQQDLQVATEVVNEVFAGGVTAQAESAPHDLMMPVRAPVGSTFGVDRGTHRHGGVDLPVAVNTPVSAPGRGRVTFAGQRGNYGNLVEIDHGNGVVTRMAHLNRIDVAVGDTVNGGQVIARSGGARGSPGAGNSQGPHVHYEVRVNGRAVDPTQRQQVTGGATSGGETSLLGMLQSLRSDPRLANNPRRLAEAERQVRSLYQAREEGDRRGREDALNSAYEWLARNGGRLEAMPNSIRSRVEGRDLPALTNFSNAVQRPERPTDDGARPLWGQLRQEIADGRITRVEQLNRYIPELTPALYGNLVTTVTGARRGDQSTVDSLRTTRQAIGYVDAEMRAAGLVPPTASSNQAQQEAYAQFRGALLMRIEMMEQAKGSALTSSEARDAALSMLAEETVGGRRWFGLRSPRTRRAYEAPAAQLGLPPGIPEPTPAIVARISAALAREGTPVTTENIGRYYMELINRRPAR